MLFPFDRPEIFAMLGVLVALIRYGTYIRSIYKGTTRPHIFSWLTWGLMVGIGAVAQYRLEGGPSTYVLICVSAFCFLIAFIALFRGEKEITRTDWIAFSGALIAIPAWQATHNPAWALVILIGIDIFSYYPTIRKSWKDPWSESAGSLFWSGLRYFFAMLAVPSFIPRNLMYPFWLMIADWGFMFYIVLRCRRLGGLKLPHGTDESVNPAEI